MCRVHVGDMANLVLTYAIDGERSVIAPVILEAHSLIGAAAVALPGTTLGKSATLGAAAATLPGAQLPGASRVPALSNVHTQARHPCNEYPAQAKAFVRLATIPLVCQHQWHSSCGAVSLSVCFLSCYCHQMIYVPRFALMPYHVDLCLVEIQRADAEVAVLHRVQATCCTWEIQPCRCSRAPAPTRPPGPASRAPSSCSPHGPWFSPCSPSASPPSPPTPPWSPPLPLPPSSAPR